MCERFIGLVRVSTDRQGESRLGLEAGLADLKRYVDSKGQDAELITVLEEVESGTHDELIHRPTLLKALTLCKRHKAILLIPRVDRLVRSTIVHADIKRSRVPVRFADNPAATEVIIDIQVALSADAGRKISETTKRALAAYKARGGLLGANLVGCHLTDEDRSKGRAKGNQKQAKEALDVYDDLLPDMRRWKAEGLTLQKIADRLNAEGHTTRTGAKWSPVQVKRTLDRS